MKHSSFNRIIALILAFVAIVFTLTSCSKESNNTPTSTVAPETKKPESAYSQLNSDERKIYDAIIKESWFSPSSVRVIEIRWGKATSPSSYDCFHVNISGTNKLGGNITEWYTVHIGYLEKSYMYSHASTTDKASASKINAALKEHWEELGL